MTTSLKKMFFSICNMKATRSYFATHIAIYWRVQRVAYTYIRISQFDPRLGTLSTDLPTVRRRRFLARIFEDAFQSRLRKGFKRGYRSRSKIGICELARRAEPERNRNPREPVLSIALGVSLGLSSPRERSCKTL